MLIKGDKIIIYWDEGSIEGEIIHMPQGNGDVLQIRTKKGKEQIINPYYYKLDTIQKLPKGE